MRIPLLTLKRIYRIVVEAYCNNGTQPIDVEESEEEGDESSSSETESSDEYIGYDEELHKMGRPRGRPKVKQTNNRKSEKEKETKPVFTPRNVGKEPMD